MFSRFNELGTGKPYSRYRKHFHSKAMLSHNLQTAINTFNNCPLQSANFYRFFYYRIFHIANIGLLSTFTLNHVNEQHVNTMSRVGFAVHTAAKTIKHHFVLKMNPFAGSRTYMLHPPLPYRPIATYSIDNQCFGVTPYEWTSNSGLTCRSIHLTRLNPSMPERQG